MKSFGFEAINIDGVGGGVDEVEEGAGRIEDDVGVGRTAVGGYDSAKGGGIRGGREEDEEWRQEPCGTH